jgi:hypothetical protein
VSKFLELRDAEEVAALVEALATAYYAASDEVRACERLVTYWEGEQAKLPADERETYVGDVRVAKHNLIEAERRRHRYSLLHDAALGIQIEEVTS